MFSLARAVLPRGLRKAREKRARGVGGLPRRRGLCKRAREKHPALRALAGAHQFGKRGAQAPRVRPVSLRVLCCVEVKQIARQKNARGKRGGGGHTLTRRRSASTRARISRVASVSLLAQVERNNRWKNSVCALGYRRCVAAVASSA